MNRKIIACRVRDEYVEGAGVVAGAAGSGGDAVLQLEFGPRWEGLAKYVTFRDARKENPVTVLVTTDMIERIVAPVRRLEEPEERLGEECRCECREILVYNVPIPAKAKAVAGQMGVVVQGYELSEDGKKVEGAVMTANAYYKILPADHAPVEDGSVTATLSQQLQGEIEKIKKDIVGAAGAAEAKEAAEKAAAAAEAHRQEAAEKAGEAAQAAQAAGESAGEAEEARREAKAAQDSAQAHRQEAERAKESAEEAGEKAELARAGAEEARHSAELAQVGAEEAERRGKGYRDEALSARDAARDAQEKAEKARTEAVGAKETAEECRTQAWMERLLAEDARDDAEKARDHAGIFRGEAQTAQKEAQDARDEAVLTLQQIRMEHSDIQEAGAEVKEVRDQVRTDRDQIRADRDQVRADRDQVRTDREAAERARDEAQEARDDAQGHRQEAEEAERKAEEWAQTARDLSGGDVATRTEAKGYVEAHDTDPKAHEGTFLPLSGGTLQGTGEGKIQIDPELNIISIDGKGATHIELYTGGDETTCSVVVAGGDKNMVMGRDYLYADYWPTEGDGADLYSFMLSMGTRERKGDQGLFVPIIQFEDCISGFPGIILSGVNDPEEEYDAANKRYVDGAVQGLFGNAPVKETPQEGDFIPVIDSADQEQMKKFPAKWLLEAKPGAWGTGSVCELDLEKSRIGGSLFTAYEGETPLSEEEGDVELKIGVSDRFMREDETGAVTLTDVALWAGAEASGVPRAFIQMEGQEEIWVGKSWEEREGRWGEVPLTLDYDNSKHRGLLRFRVTSEDGKTVKRYVVLVQKVSGSSAIKSVTYTSAQFQAELQYEADGVTPLTLGEAEAEERYLAMAEAAAEYVPDLGITGPVVLSQWERDRYRDEEGNPIRRLLYKGWLPSGKNNGILTSSIPIRITAEKGTSIAMIYRKDAPKPTQPSAKPKYVISGTFQGGTSKTSLTRPLIAVRDTDGWDQACVRVYFQVKAEDGTMTYGVLELYNTRQGNSKLGRIAVGEDGGPEKDPLAKPVETVTQWRAGQGTETLAWENWNGAKLKELGSTVDREGDWYAVWAYDKELPFQEGLLPNTVVAADNWAEAPEKEGEDIDAEHAAPTRLTAWVSPESATAAICARTEDPRAYIDVCQVGEDGKLHFEKYLNGYLKHGEERVNVYDEADPERLIEHTDTAYGFLAELDAAAAAGEVCATVAIHVKGQDETNANQHYGNSGRLYYLDLKKGYAGRDLTALEALGEDMAAEAGTVDGEAMTAALETQEGWGWVKLTAAAQEGEETPLIHVLRPNVYGEFVREERLLLPGYGARSGEDAPDLDKPMKGAAGAYWVKLRCPGTYRVVTTSQNGLWDKWGKEYTLTLTEKAEQTEQTEVGDEAQ